MRGHVCKRGNRFYAVLYLPDEHGVKKQRWFSGFPTRKSADEFVVRKILDLQTSQSSGPTFEEYLSSWFDYQRSRLRPGTIRSYQWLINKYILPRFGSTRLSDVTVSQLQDYYLLLMKSGLSNQTVLNLHRVLKTSLSDAVNEEKVKKNIASLVKPPRVTTPIFETWSVDQIKKFLSCAESSKYWIVFFVLLSTGMRLGEALALRWQDCDLVKGEIRVRRTLAYTGHGYKPEPPKTRHANRSIALPEVVIQKLSDHHQESSASISPDSLVFCTDSGKPVLQHNLRMLFYSLIKQAGVPKIRIHDLRHTHASLLLQQGIHPKIVQERLGHASVETTLNIYSHVMPNLQKEAAKAFDELII